MKTRSLALCVLISLALWHGLAHATRSFTNVQTPTAATAIFDMGSTQSLSYLITNTNTAGNAGERIYQVRFRINSGSLFSNTTVAPAGWTLSAFTTTSVTFQAISWANVIAVGGSANFTLVLTLRSTTADATETLRDIRASYTSRTTGAFTPAAGTVTTTTPGSWTLKSLAVTFLITDLSGTNIATLTAGGSFRLVMTVKNNSTVTQSGISSIPNPPSTVETGTVTQTLTGTVGSPLTLATCATTCTGTITFTFSTAAGDSGTIFFTAFAQKIAGITSKSATSPTLTVTPCTFTASFTAPASTSCLYPGSNITLTMALTNNCASALTSVKPALATTGPATIVSGPSGPVPPTNFTMAAGVTTPVTWVYKIDNSVATNPFTFSGSATHSLPSPPTAIATSPSITRGEFPTVLNPAVTNASSTNVELKWSVTNSGCFKANSVAVTFPAGWVWANDAYSLVNLSAINPVETWVASGANPVTFTSPNIANQMPLGFDGDFSLVFSATPASTGVNIFTVVVTDASGNAINVPVSATVNPFNSGALNSLINNIWHELVP